MDSSTVDAPQSSHDATLSVSSSSNGKGWNKDWLSVLVSSESVAPSRKAVVADVRFLKPSIRSEVPPWLLLDGVVSFSDE